MSQNHPLFENYVPGVALKIHTRIQTCIHKNKNKGLLASRIPVVQKGCKTVCWTTDGSRLIAGTKDGLICVVDPHSGATMLVFQAHRSDITCLAVTPDGRKIVSGGSDGLVKIWDASAPY